MSRPHAEGRPRRSAPDAPYKRLLTAGPGTRKEARTWLTYPEWHIVYSAESYGRFLDSRPPSAFPYFRHIAGFWSSYCALNKVTSSSAGTGEAKVMIYTIGISFTERSASRPCTRRRSAGSSSGPPAAQRRRFLFGFGAEALRRLHARDALVRIPVREGVGAAPGGHRGDRPEGSPWRAAGRASDEYGVKAGYACLMARRPLGARPGPAKLRFGRFGLPGDDPEPDPRLRPWRTWAGPSSKRLVMRSSPRS